MQDLLVAAALFVAAFLLGSVPWGLIISKVFYHTDLREHGSGNIGTTNAIRTMGKVGGYAVFVLDFGKGLLSGVLAWWFSWQFLPGGGLVPGALVSYDTMLAVAFLGCVWGHIFSPWLGFKGGKGIAVAVGCLFVTFGWVGACLELLIFIVLVVATKRVSIGSIALLAVLLLGRLDRRRPVHAGGADGGVGAPWEHQAIARRHREQDRRQEESVGAG